MIKAFGKRVIVSVVDLNKEQKVGSLIMPTKDDLITGIVIDYGYNVDDGLEPGDVVYFNKHDGIPVKINGDDYLSIREESILAGWKDK